MVKDNLYEQICDMQNLEFAYNRAKKGKTGKDYVKEFTENLKENLISLQTELLLQIYRPKPLQTFILRDPKTRKISKSHFRDRIVHHAIHIIIEELFDKKFIYDSYANRMNKGTFKAIERFDAFKKKVSKNNTKTCFVLKCDIRKYFDTVNHEILLELFKKEIKDEKVLWLIKVILDNHSSDVEGRGMPLGNLTSQFFANVYLNELDQFVKHKLRAKYYIRYVDDFAILHENQQVLEEYKEKIDQFLVFELMLSLHPDKSKIMTLKRGINFLGFRLFYHHKLLRRKNVNKFHIKYLKLKYAYSKDEINREEIREKVDGWLAYASHGNTYKYRKELLKDFDKSFPYKPTNEPLNLKVHNNFIEKIEKTDLKFSHEKTLEILKSGLNIEQIAEKREIKIGTVWEHTAKLIVGNQIHIFEILSKVRVHLILNCIKSENDKLKDVKARLKEDVPYEEISCVMAYYKLHYKKKNIGKLIVWYQITHCQRKCFKDKQRLNECKIKFNLLLARNPTLKMGRTEFVKFFNEHMNICTLSEHKKRRYVSWNQYQMMLKSRRK